MGKRPLHGLSLVSAVVCVLSLLLVGRSYFYMDRIWVSYSQGDAVMASSLDGLLVLHVQQMDAHSREVGYSGMSASKIRPDYDIMWSLLRGVRWLRIGWDDNLLILPLWLVPVVTGVLPVRWWMIRRRRVRAGRGFAVEVVGAEASGATENTEHTE
jgi:hypothetical protein